MDEDQVQETNLDKILKGLNAIETRLDKIEKESEDEVKTALLNVNAFTKSRSGNSDEKKAMLMFGAKDVKKLVEVNTALPQFKRYPVQVVETVKNLKESIDIGRMISQLFYGDPLDREVGQELVAGNCKSLLHSHYGKEVLAPMLKAFDTATNADWINTVTSANYIDEYELPRVLGSNFRTINMPSNPFNQTVKSGQTFAKIQAELGTVAAQSFATPKITFDATKLTCFEELSSEITEDSAPDLLSVSRADIIQAQERSTEQAYTDGDNSVTHMDSDVTDADDSRKAWKGLRKLAIDNSANGSLVDFGDAVVTLAKMREMRKAGGKYFVNPAQCLFVCSPKIQYEIQDVDEVVTIDLFGPNATILKGQIGAIDGIPIVTSEFVRDDLNAAGVYDGVTTDLSVLHLCNKTRFLIGQRRPIRVRVTPDPTPPADEWLLASWQRQDFQGQAQDADEVSTVLGINIA